MTIYRLAGSQNESSIFDPPIPSSLEEIRRHYDNLSRRDGEIRQQLEFRNARTGSLGDPLVPQVLTDLSERPAVCLIGDGTSFASHRIDTENQAHARMIGAGCAEAGWRLFVGGAHGLLRHAIEGALEKGGSVVIITSPQTLERKVNAPVMNDFAGRLHMTAVAKTPDHVREFLTTLADAFVIMPGGMNTLKTLSEVVTQHQLSQFAMNRSGGRKKPVFAYNESGFWDPTHDLIKAMTRQKLLSETHLDIIHFKYSCEGVKEGLFAAMRTELPLGKNWPSMQSPHMLMGFDSLILGMCHPDRRSVLNAMRGISLENPLFFSHDTVIPAFPSGSDSPPFLNGEDVRVLVFSGARNGKGDQYLKAGYDIGRMIAESGATLVNGGGNSGIMNAAIHGAHKSSGKIVAIVPIDIGLGKATSGNEGFNGHAINFVTDNMHWRKRAMGHVTDIVVLAPGGGFGSVEEFGGELYWNVVNSARAGKQILVDNRYGLWDGLERQLEQAVKQGLMPPGIWSHTAFYGASAIAKFEADLKGEVARIRLVKTNPTPELPAYNRPGCASANHHPC